MLNLAEIFRYFLQNERSRITVADEVRIVKAYLEVEQLRLGDRLTVEWSIDPEALPAPIPPLSIEPLVENAVKHGVARKPGRGKVSLIVRRLQSSIEVEVRDTGDGFDAGSGGGNGIGLDNVRQRLALSYGSAAALEIRSSTEGTTVRFTAPLDPTRLTDVRLPAKTVR